MANSVVAMTFPDGTVLNTWLSFTLRDSFIDPLGALDFEVAPPLERLTEHLELLKKGTLVVVAINGVTQGQFVIQTVRQSISRNGVVFDIKCVSPIVNAYEGAAPPAASFKALADAPATDFVKRVLTPYGFTQVTGDSKSHVNALTGKPIGGGEAEILVDELTHKEAQAQDNETAYGLCARVVTRFGVCIRVAHDSKVTAAGGGKVMLVAPDYAREPNATACQTFGAGVPDADRFFGSIEVIDTNDGQFAMCVVTGQHDTDISSRETARPSSGVRSVDLSKGHPPYVSDVLTYKPLIIRDKHSRDRERCKSAAMLALGLRAKDAFVVTGNVGGFLSATGSLWQVDTICRVVVEAYRLDEDMWLLERTFHCDRDGGQWTALKFIPKGSLVLGELPTKARTTKKFRLTVSDVEEVKDILSGAEVG